MHISYLKSKIMKKSVTILILTGAVLFGVLNPQNATAAENSIVGPWIVEVFPDPQPGSGSFKNLAVFTPDGGNINTDPDVGTGIGVWERVRNREFKTKFFTIVSALLPEDSPLPYKPGSTITVTGTKLTLNQRGDKLEGPFVIEFTDKVTGEIVRGTGNATLTRITTETSPP
jgi:hypothetical protein